MTTPADDLLTTGEVADLLGVSVWTVRYHYRKGRLEGVHNGVGRLRFTGPSVRKFACDRESWV